MFNVAGRVEIKKVNQSIDTALSNKHFDIKYNADRPSISYQKKIIDETTDYNKRNELQEKFKDR